MWLHRLFQVGWVELLSSVIDIILVSIAIYLLMMFAKRSRAWRVIWGLVIFFLFLYVSRRLGLVTINWLLQSFLPLGPVAIVLLFYPELRHLLEEMGKWAGWSRGFSRLAKEDVSTIIQTIAEAASRMSAQRVGALIVLERDVGLESLIETGTVIQGAVSAHLLTTIFYPGSALHDGAVIIRGNKLVAAGCILPLSESVHIGTMIHTRHKAAIGVTEQSDAVVVVVSEETGTISLALEGKLHSGLNQDTLSTWLKSIFGDGDNSDKSQFRKTVDVTLRRAGLRYK
ncbi:MAG: diadenylate cyclase CdaA [Armatimonadota bacterium]